MMVNFKYRSRQPELMDDPEADRTDLHRVLNYLEFVNGILGGNALLRNGLSCLLNKFPDKKHWRILDVGCGRGDQLLVMKSWAEKQDCTIELSGLDNNPAVLEEAKSNPELSGMRFHVADALGKDFDYSQYDLITCTLFLHHLSDRDISTLLIRWNNSGTNLLINDLHRSPMAWILFMIFSLITLAPQMARYDGALSVRKGFTRNELDNLIAQSGFKKLALKWKWAFRYQVLLGHE